MITLQLLDVRDDASFFVKLLRAVPTLIIPTSPISLTTPLNIIASMRTRKSAVRKVSVTPQKNVIVKKSRICLRGRQSQWCDSSQQVELSKEATRREQLELQSQGIRSLKALFEESLRENSIATAETLQRIERQNECIINELKEIRLFLIDINERYNRKGSSIVNGEDSSVIPVASAISDPNSLTSGFVNFKPNISLLDKPKVILKSEGEMFFGYHWHIRIQRIDDQFGVFLECSNIEAGLSMDVEFSLLLWSSQRLTNHKNRNTFSRESKAWGKSAFVSWSAIIDTNNGFPKMSGDPEIQFVRSMLLAILGFSDYYHRELLML
uniref:MATH domain-containing protein n=1 Tax=Ditylenchus dipsaci TaxID=166011 RepID=A0A915E008_9BILA